MGSSAVAWTTSEHTRGCRLALIIATAGVGLGLMAWGTASHLARAGDLFRNQPKRLWEDLGLAVGCYLYREFPVTHNPFRKLRDEEGRPLYTEPQGTLARATHEQGIRSWEFWRTVPEESLRRPKPAPFFPRFDDAGRAVLLCLLFRVLGGVAPFLVFWLGLLVAIPLVLWIAFEFSRTEYAVAGLFFVTLLGLSAFVVELLALPYAAIGFYLLGILVLVAMSVHANLGRPSSPLGFAIRMALGGTAFAVCALGRSSCLFLLPGLVLAMGIAVARAAPDPPRERGSSGRPFRRRLEAGIIGLGLLVVPYLVASDQLERVTDRTLAAHASSRSIPQHHPVWFNLWMGLGDFDRTKGYVWDDHVASSVAVERGGTPITPSFLDPQDERILRDLMLADIESNPLWYAKILGKRLLVTLTQWKLHPWGPLGGVSMAPRGHPNEGQVDSYYGLTATADFFGLGSHRLEAPVELLVLPGWVLATVACIRGPGPGRQRRRRSVGVLLCVAAGTLPLPMLVTTAGGPETEAFALTYFLGVAFSIEELVRWRAETGAQGPVLFPAEPSGTSR